MVVVVLAVVFGHTGVEAGGGLSSEAVAAVVLAGLAVHSRGLDCSVDAS